MTYDPDETIEKVLKLLQQINIRRNEKCKRKVLDS